MGKLLPLQREAQGSAPNICPYGSRYTGERLFNILLPACFQDKV